MDCPQLPPSTRKPAAKSSLATFSLLRSVASVDPRDAAAVAGRSSGRGGLRSGGGGNDRRAIGDAKRRRGSGCDR